MRQARKTLEQTKTHFWVIFYNDHVGLVSKEILGLVKVLIFFFGIRMGGKRVRMDFEIL